MLLNMIHLDLNNDVPPDDYYERQLMTRTNKWIHLFKDVNDYKVIKINNSYHINWMK